ncbi:lipoyl(octanoyl) transferase [Desulfuromusa kysingii]|uniref:Octanoyltransferase n=1 Tax=Desulfuromusa kysingii TaxID=37625 RepID=A0A1H4D534_9BACT|nr:lipoyl(octanoyl) transferase LipB [Desulfuromusa kysingii]SEA67721.1 lipoyl(octanoyl) transferase [Desulfuromusa kysingii]
MNDPEKEITPLTIDDWGLTDYRLAFDRQTEMVTARLSGRGADTLVFVEHPATVTLGRRATEDDLHLSEKGFSERGVTLQRINRGGLVTAHEPGQLVVYPLIVLKKHDLRWYANRFLQVVISLLADYGVVGYLKDGEPGVWVNGCKICSFGIALKKWISSHGIALNINNSLDTFTMIVPCGRPDEVVTSLARELGRPVDMAEAKKRFSKHFCQAFAYEEK